MNDVRPCGQPADAEVVGMLGNSAKLSQSRNIHDRFVDDPVAQRRIEIRPSRQDFNSRHLQLNDRFIKGFGPEIQVRIPGQGNSPRRIAGLILYENGWGREASPLPLLV